MDKTIEGIAAALFNEYRAGGGIPEHITPWNRLDGEIYGKGVKRIWRKMAVVALETYALELGKRAGEDFEF